MLLLRTNCQIETKNSLSHVEKGALSVARDGQEVVIALGPAVALDLTHQVRLLLSAHLLLFEKCY